MPTPYDPKGNFCFNHFVPWILFGSFSEPELISDSPLCKKKHSKHAKYADKHKKKCKKSDFKTYVGNKLLSRSEKNLEKLMHFDDKGIYETVS